MRTVRGPEDGARQPPYEQQPSNPKASCKHIVCVGHGHNSLRESDSFHCTEIMASVYNTNVNYDKTQQPLHFNYFSHWLHRWFAGQSSIPLDFLLPCLAVLQF